MQKLKGFSKGGELHETMIDCIELFLAAKFGIKTIRSYHENGFIYDLYAPKYDVPIEIYSNKTEKLQNLLEKKQKICLINSVDILETYKRGSKNLFHWLSHGDEYGFRYCAPKNYKERFSIIFVSKYKLKGYKHWNEWVMSKLNS